MFLISWTWWSDLVPLWSAGTLRTFFAVFLGMTVLGAIVRMVSRRRLKDRFHVEVWRRLATLFVVMGLLGVWYWFVGLQQVPFLSARFWLFAWVLGGLVWLGFVLRYARKTVPELREALAQREEGGDKYLQPDRKQKQKQARY